MKRISMFAAALALVSLPAAPAMAGWKLVTHGVAAAVARTTMTVTPGEDWNRSSVHPIKQSELWTLDGLGLNELYLVSALLPGQTLYKDANKKEQPLPAMGNGMQLTEIPEFFESSNRVVLNTSVFRISGVEPMSISGHEGVKFTFEYAVAGSALTRKGVAAGTLVDNKLYLISFTAPSIYYFERDKAKAEAVMASVHL